MESKQIVRRSFVMGLVLTGVLALSAHNAGAQTLILSPGVEGNSWSSTMSFDDWDTFDTLELFIVSDTGAGPWQAPGFGDPREPDGPNDPVTDWNPFVYNDSWVKVTGPDRIGLRGTLLFAGDMSETVIIDMLTWNGGVGGTLGTVATFTFSGGDPIDVAFGTQNITYSDGLGYDRTVQYVPEGSPLIAIGLGLALLGGARQRRRNFFGKRVG